MDKRFYEMHANVCATLGNAKRIQIIDLLKDGEKTASTLAHEMDIPKANLSQHLHLMKSRGILLSRREGVSIYYRIANPKILSACQIMMEVLMDQLDDISKLREEYNQTT